MTEKKRKKVKPKKNIILRLAIVSFFVFILVTIVDQQIQISQKQDELAGKESELQLSKIKAMDLEKKSELAEEFETLTVSEVNPKNMTDKQKECEEYLRQEALRLGYAKSGVRVFQNIAGN